MVYVRRHWQGEASLAQAFWINFVLLRLAFLFADYLFQPPFTDRLGSVPVLATAYFVVSLAVVYPWQVVGLVRAGDRLAGKPGAMATIHWINFSIVASLLLTAASLYSVFQPLAVEQPAEPQWQTLERERASKYAIDVDESGHVIRIRGEFERGLAKNLERQIAAHPGIREVVLESEGGFVIQGRAVANVIVANGFDTRVEGVCKSACVLAFVAGKVRRLGRDARLGFHQYRVDEKMTTPVVDLAAEHQRDRDFLIGRGVDPAFAARAYRAVHASIWFPENQELLDAGVVHEIVE